MTVARIILRELVRASIMTGGMAFALAGVWVFWHPISIFATSAPEAVLAFSQMPSYILALGLLLSGFWTILIYFKSFKHPFPFTEKVADWNAKQEVKKWMEKPNGA